MTDDSFTSRASPPVIDHIEDMVLSFLSQLAFPGKHKDKEELSERSDAANKAPSRSDYKIIIPLVDRRKSQVEGWFTALFRKIVVEGIACNLAFLRPNAFNFPKDKRMEAPRHSVIPYIRIYAEKFWCNMFCDDSTIVQGPGPCSWSYS